MKTLEQFAQGLESVPTLTSFYLADLGEARGRQELLAAQSAESLKALRDLRAQGAVECLGRGPGAQWRKKGKLP
jgi:hypothetical protein